MTKMYKIMFSTSLIMGTLIAISSYSWMGMWLGLEINLLSIIPLLSSNKNVLCSEASLKYFITQAIGSAILLFSIVVMMTKTSMNNNTEPFQLYLMILNSALLMKMGAAPFHFWFPEVMEGLSWMNCLIMLTWQKIAPMVLLMYNIKMINFMSIIIVTSMMISGIMGMNQTSLRKIMAYSSINHIAWMIASMMFMETIWFIYFVTYTLISINIIIIFYKYNVFFMNQLFTSLNNNLPLKLFFIMNFFSLGGLPPFLGFLPKWLTIQMMIQNKLYFLSMIMVLMTLITLYFYMRISFSSTLINTSELNWMIQIKTKMFKNPTIFMFNFITLTSLMLCTLMFNWM